MGELRDLLQPQFLICKVPDKIHPAVVFSTYDEVSVWGSMSLAQNKLAVFPVLCHL